MTDTDEIAAFLRGFPPFDELEASQLSTVAAAAQVRHYRQGEDVLIEDAQPAAHFFVIRQGSMVVEKDIGGKPVFLSYLPAGSYVGEMALIDGGRRTATVRAAIKSEVIKLGGDAFRALLEREPQLLDRFKRDMASRYELTSFI